MRLQQLNEILDNIANHINKQCNITELEFDEYGANNSEILGAIDAYKWCENYIRELKIDETTTI